AFADKGCRADFAERHDTDVDHGQFDGERQADRLFEPRSRGAFLVDCKRSGASGLATPVWADDDRTSRARARRAQDVRMRVTSTWLQLRLFPQRAALRRLRTAGSDDPA